MDKDTVESVGSGGGVSIETFAIVVFLAILVLYVVMAAVRYRSIRRFGAKSLRRGLLEALLWPIYEEQRPRRAMAEPEITPASERFKKVIQEKAPEAKAVAGGGGGSGGDARVVTISEEAGADKNSSDAVKQD